MNKKLTLALVAILAAGYPSYSGFTSVAQASQTQQTVSGKLTDQAGEPIIGAMVENKNTKARVLTDVDGLYRIPAKPGDELVYSYLGMQTKTVKVTGSTQNISLNADSNMLDDVVVTALGIKKDRKSLGYSIDEVGAEELMKNKSTNAINSLSGKIAGVNITQSGGAPGSGSQIILRGGTSLERDNQPVFVVDGIIYDNSTNVVGNSAFDGSTPTSSTQGNRLMDINPEDIESMSVLKGPAAAALYGSRAAAGVILITTKKGKQGSVEINLSTTYTNQWATHLPKTQKKYVQGFYENQYDASGKFTGVAYNDFSYNSWGRPYEAGEEAYDNIGGFFQHGNITDTNLSVSGGSETGNFFLSASYYNQGGIIPKTGFEKATFRFNGEQRWKMLTFTANASYSQSNTDKTITSAALYGSSGNGAMYSVYTWSPSNDMAHYQNEDGTRYRVFGDRLDAWSERSNPYWIVNNDKLTDKTERFTGSIAVRADITNWWWLQYRTGIDSYTTDNDKRIKAGGVYKEQWQEGMLSENSYRYKYWSQNVMTNFNKQFGQFDFNLLAGLQVDETNTTSNYRMAYNFEVPNFYSFGNATDANRDFRSTRSHKRLIGLYGEFRADWNNTLFLTFSARNDWSSTLPKANRSYFYPAVSGSFVFTELFPDKDWYNKDVISFGKIRASWARVGKDTSPYNLQTALWAAQQFIGGITGTSDYWQSGNAYLKPEITESTEIGLEMRFFHNRLKFDYAYYTNDSKNQIMSPRLSNATGYILRMVNAGDIYNKGMEIMVGGIPVQTKDWQWETSINVAGNRGKVKNLMEGVEILYVTDMQAGGVKAASFPDGNFMSISGNKWYRVDSEMQPQLNGQIILDQNGMPTYNTSLPSNEYIANREPKFAGGWNNTLTYKNFTFNMLWEFRVGGAVYNGTQYSMMSAGTSKASGNRESITISGVQADGSNADGTPKYTDVKTFTYEANKTYQFNGKETSGRTIINNYLQGAYLADAYNFTKKVNALRMRTVSLSYQLPQSVVAKTKCIKRCIFTASANNLLLFTNYEGDPEVSAAGSGVTGSSSVGIDYCGVPSTASFSFGVNLTF